MVKIKKALISVSDKSNLKKLIKTLVKHKIDLISSGGTYRFIKKLGFKCEQVSNYTKSPEILNGRVKTLHPKIHSGILSRRNVKSDKLDLKKLNFEEIDLIIVNFYPFEKILKEKYSHDKVIENIDIGGPTLARSAAKNYKFVTVITESSQYEDLINEIDKNKGSTSLFYRKKLSEHAFYETGYYDTLIANYFSKLSQNNFPNKKLISLNLVEKLRYGENPHQEAAVYSLDKKVNMNQLNGKKLSYNNYNDIFSALMISKNLPKNKGVVIIKHGNPCGISINKNKVKSYKLALSCDPISAFGGIVGCNFKLNKSLALELKKIFLEVVIANGFEKDALRILKQKNNLRIIDASKFGLKNFHSIVSNFGNFLIQNYDNVHLSAKNFNIVSKKKPDKKTLNSLIFAFNMCRFVKSNAIVLVKDDTTVGIGSGQTSRLDSCKIAIQKMQEFHKKNANDKIVCASDAFFPFADGIEKLVQAGVRAIIQPSGSIRDKEIIKYADSTDTVLIFSKTRHFKH